MSDPGFDTLGVACSNHAAPIEIHQNRPRSGSRPYLPPGRFRWFRVFWSDAWVRPGGRQIPKIIAHNGAIVDEIEINNSYDCRQEEIRKNL
jgi:hypothetical protein